MQNALLFVYGTLRHGTGHPMALRLAAEAQWLGRATAKGRLYRIDWYPALVAGPGPARVVGDLFRLADPAASLAWLDAYEGCGLDDTPLHEYHRVQIEIEWQENPHRAQTYLWTRSLDGLYLIEGGDWLEAEKQGDAA